MTAIHESDGESSDDNAMPQGRARWTPPLRHFPPKRLGYQNSFSSHLSDRTKHRLGSKITSMQFPKRPLSLGSWRRPY
jgi:hypothetical protein